VGSITSDSLSGLGGGEFVYQIIGGEKVSLDREIFPRIGAMGKGK